MWNLRSYILSCLGWWRSRLQQMRAFWLPARLFRSGWSRSIPIRSTVLILFSCSFLLCSLLLYANASASPLLLTATPGGCPEGYTYNPGGCVRRTNTPGPSPTAFTGGGTDVPLPTGTYGSLLQTATALADEDNIEDCPVGSPYGWGEVTPDAMWRYRCSHCIANGATTTPYPCPTPYIFDPAGACILPTPGGPTATAAPGGAVEFQYNVTFDDGGDDYTIERGTVGSGPAGSNGNVLISEIDPVIVGSFQERESSIFIPVEGGTVGGVTMRYWVYTSAHNTFGRLIRVYDGATLLEENFCSSCVFPESQWISSFIDIEDQDCEGGCLVYVRIGDSWRFDTRIHYLDDIIVWMEADALATPTPLPTGAPFSGVPSYCDVVHPDTSGPGGNGGLLLNGAPGIFEMPQVAIGAAQCQSFASYEFEINEYGFTTVLWPSITLCILPVTLGKLVVFGMTFNLDTIFGSLVGFWLLWKFWG